MSDPATTTDLHENGSLAWLLQQMIEQGAYGLNDIPGVVKRVIEENRWRNLIVKVTGEHQHYDRFADYVCAHPPDGLGTDLGTLKRLCREQLDVVDAIDRVTGHHQGERADLLPDNFLSNRKEVEEWPKGTTRQYALRRLHKDRPDLHARVLAGDLTPHAAMVEAGFRPQTITIRLDDPASAALTLQKHAAPEFLAALRTALACVS